MNEILDLQQLIDFDTSAIDREPSLPVCHTTPEFNLGKIIKSKVIKSEHPCKIFKEKLIFLFYGKAEYMPRKDDKDEMRPYAPVTFLYKLDSINEFPKRMLPFDSGGIDLYDLHMNIEDFVIEQPTESKIKSYIQKVFGTSKHYFIPKIIIDPDKYPMVYQLKEIKRMFEMYKQEARFSHRAFTLELQYPGDEEAKFLFNPYRVYLPYKLFTALKKMNEINLYFPGIEVEYYGNGTENDIGSKYREMRHKVQTYIQNQYR